MIANDSGDASAEGRALRSGWYVEMPEGTLATYDEPLNATLMVADRIATLPASTNPSENS
jgi:hypothetical protein